MTSSQHSTAAASGALSLRTEFGEFEVPSRDIIAFPNGLPGFERSRRFVLLSAGLQAPFQCLQSVEGPGASFVVVDPRWVLDSYRAVLSDMDRFRLGATPDTPLLWLAIVILASDGEAYANLRAPVVVNPETMIGFQIMPPDSLYPLRHPLPRE